MNPRLLIIHAGPDARSGALLADAFARFGVRATPLSRLLPTKAQLFGDVVTSLIYGVDAVVLLISPHATTDRLYSRFLRALSRLAPIVASPRVTAVRLGALSIPGIVNSGYVTASYAHFTTADGITSVAKGVLDALRASAGLPTGPLPLQTSDRETIADVDLVPRGAPKRSARAETLALAFRSDLMLVTAALAAAFGILATAMQGAGIFLSSWWIPLIFFGLFVTVRSLAIGYLNLGLPPETADKRSFSWAPRLAAIVGATTAIITALLKGGESVAHYALTAQDQANVAAQTRAKEIQERAKAYLDRTLSDKEGDRSIDERLTLLNFLIHVPAEDGLPQPAEGVNSPVTVGSGLNSWAKVEHERLESQRAALLGIVQQLLDDCETSTSRCLSDSLADKSRRKTIGRIVRQVGPSALHEKKLASRVASMGIQIAQISGADLEIAAPATRADPDSVAIKVIPRCVPGTVRARETVGLKARRDFAQYCGKPPNTATLSGDSYEWTMPARTVNDLDMPQMECSCIAP